MISKVVRAVHWYRFQSGDLELMNFSQLCVYGLNFKMYMIPLKIRTHLPLSSDDYMILKVISYTLSMLLLKYSGILKAQCKISYTKLILYFFLKNFYHYYEYYNTKLGGPILKRMTLVIHNKTTGSFTIKTIGWMDGWMDEWMDG